MAAAGPCSRQERRHWGQVHSDGDSGTSGKGCRGSGGAGLNREEWRCDSAAGGLSSKTGAARRKAWVAEWGRW